MQVILFLAPRRLWSCTGVWGRQYYSVGPPYVIHASDVVPLAEEWARLVPRTYDHYPMLYAEMFAYSMASAQLGLKHTLHKVGAAHWNARTRWRAQQGRRDAHIPKSHEKHQS